MKLLKDDIRRRILDVAEEDFLRLGYVGTSVRDIAKAASVGVGNIYCYFKSKDEIFSEVVRPVVRELDDMMQRHHGEVGEDVMELLDEEYLRECTLEYVQLVRRQRDLLMILLFRSEGSSMAGYRGEYTERSAVMVRGWLERMRERYPEAGLDVSEAFMHLQMVWMFDVLEEVLRGDLTEGEVERLIGEYVRFEVCGWKAMFGLERMKDGKEHNENKI